ncbi:helix-turn-helix transcriptional regulator [Sphingopyxis witflariensis]|uniref:Helix-turn-helix domain-containing protein n=1 Tax=Sphingopyxis witflariensis TaxID=173675 RepID=A0A2D0ANF5_9SPHN|nr:helix-turn-helix domain-containing protein [Sphingopyxis witflariensis]OWQ95123.1 hypothetical protein CDQ91_14480 [Sphingopyxis witflariensis]
MMIELLTEKEAAARLRISERTLRDIRGRGEIAYVRISARKILYRLEDCDNYIASRVRQNTPLQPTERRTSRKRADGIIPFSQLMREKKERGRGERPQGSE